MNSHSRVTVLALLSASTSLASIAWTQADSATQLKPAGTTPAAVSAPDTAKHKHGMFGKLKAVAQNKTVQSIAKTAVCTAVPGGSMVVGAVDAHKNGESAAQALKGAAMGPSCMPGMGSLGALSGKGGLAGMGGAKGAMGMAAVQTSAALQTVVMNGAIAKANGDVTTESPGQQLQLSGTPADQIKKGKLVIKHIDWMLGSPSVSASSMSGFVDLFHSVGDAVKAEGAKYRVDIYMDKHYSDADIAVIAPQRVGMIISLLQDRVQAQDVTIAGNVKKDKEQRVEIVRIK
jgi:hypothetical protein